MGRSLRCSAALLAGLALLSSCQSRDEPAAPGHPEGAVRVGSFDFPESVLLGEIYAATLEDQGVDVVRELGAGPREAVAPALEQDLLDLVPEYLGTSLLFVTLGEAGLPSSPAAAHEALVRAYGERGVTVLDYAPAQNQNVIAVTTETAREHALARISDLRPVAPEMTFGGPPECPLRPLCLRGLERTYGLAFDAFLPLDTGGPMTVAALTAGEVDVGLLFSTDPVIDDPELTLLRDDRDLQPAENVVPVVRSEVAERLGRQALEAIDRVSARLTTDGLRTLNAQVALDVEPALEPADVAVAWLREEGLI
ncbi:MAG TPA: ABC transporter substrate-binding protein [Actinomycetota bacterium]|nr:ABC transporter substrate-binding protein [Actinomycetota bacterium]